MSPAELDSLIASIGPMVEEALGAIHPGILEAAQAKLEEASEKDNATGEPAAIKLTVPLKMVIRLDMSPPKCYVVSKAARAWTGEAYPEGEEPRRPKSDAERARAYRERLREYKADLKVVR